MSSRYPGDEPRRGRLTAGYGHDPEHRPDEEPAGWDEPGDDADEAVPPDPRDARGSRPGHAGGETAPGRWRGQPPVDPYPWPGQEPRDPGARPTETYRNQEPPTRNAPDGAGWRGRAADRAEPRSAGGRGDLSDLWRDPDPWAREADRGPEPQRGREPWRERDAAAAGDDPRRPRDNQARDGRAPGQPGTWRPQPIYGGGHVRPVPPDYGEPPAPGSRRDAWHEGTGREGTGRDVPPRDSGRAAPRPEQPGDVRGYVDTGPGTAARRDRGAGTGGDRTQNYQNPAAWNDDRGPGGRGRREPDGPTEAHRRPASWRERGGIPGEQPPAGRPQRPATGPGPARPGPGDGAGGGERAWWDDAFRPAPPTRDQPQRPQQPSQAQQPPQAPPRQPRLLPPGPIVPDSQAPAPHPPYGPPVPPGRPARPRSPSARGYGVPPGELTQPIPIYQPQGAYIPADTYEAEDLYEDDLYDDQTYAPDRPYRRERAPERAAEGTGLTRSTGTMAIGTLISRVTGFLRTFVFAIALGDAALANAYNNANTIPNAVYDVMIGGVLTSVVVPLLVKAAREHRDGGEAYNQRMFTLTVFALGAVTVVATIAAGLLVALYAGTVHGTEHNVMVVFAYFFIPQIFFYGMSSLIGAILNTRNSFSAPMWTPIINNVIVIVVGLLFIVSLGVHRDVGNVSSGGILLLGVGTTLGIIVQTVALVPALRRVGFRWRPRFDFRSAELGEIGRMAIWMLGYVVSTQIGFIVTTRVANSASVHVQSAGVTAYNYSYALFLMPYAIIGVSVTTALLPRMSRHAAEGRFQMVRDDFSYSARLSSVILAPAALLLAVLGAPLCELLFSYGHMTVPDARYIGEAFAAFSLGLLPFVIFQLLLRVFYALHDSRTPAIIGFWTMLATVAGNYLVLAMLPAQEVVIGMAFVYGLTSIFSAAIAWRLLARRFGGLDGSKVTRSLVRMHVAAIPALVFAFVVSVVVSGVFHPGAVYGFITVLVGGGGAVLLYVITARALHLDELAQVMRMVTGRFGGRAAQGAPR